MRHRAGLILAKCEHVQIINKREALLKLTIFYMFILRIYQNANNKHTWESPLTATLLEKPI